ncbi:MAG TPA: hypothetical protein VGK87_05280 [Anaerolineae bacterium]|jgi:hypothetical protein
MYSGADDETGKMMVAPAVIVRRWETNVVFDGIPQIGLIVEVHPAMQPSFTAEIKTVVDRSHMSLLHHGAVLLVSYHIDHPVRLSIEALPDPSSFPEPPETDSPVA